MNATLTRTVRPPSDADGPLRFAPSLAASAAAVSACSAAAGFIEWSSVADLPLAALSLLAFLEWCSARSWGAA